METNVAQLPLSHKAWAWLEKNWNQAIFGAAGAIILALAVWFFVWRSGEKQVEASRALSTINIHQTMGATAESPEAYLKIVSDYPKSKAAARALLLAASGLFSNGKYAEAQAQFERFTREHRGNPLLTQALIGIASCLEAQGKQEQAVTAYKELIARHTGDSVLPQAKFSLARLYELQKRPELARDLYGQVEQEGRFTILASEAGMRLEEIAKDNPNLAPAPAPPMALPPVMTPAATSAPPLMVASNPPVQLPKK